MMRDAVVIEKAEDRFSASVPDLPGCVAVGTTAAAEDGIAAVIRFHVGGFQENGEAVPDPSSRAAYVEA